MSNPFIPNTSAIPNILFDVWMNKLSPAEFKVLMCVARKTYGWHKHIDTISLQQIENCTGLSRKGVIKTIEALIGHGLIIKIKSKTSYGDDAPNQYEINVNCMGGGSELNPPQVVNSVHHPVVNSVHPQKKDITKERLTKEIYAPSVDDAKSSPSSSKQPSKKPKIPVKPDLVEMFVCAEDAIKFKESFGAPLVGISDEDHKALMQQYGLENTRKFYRALGDWKLSKAQVAPKEVLKHSDIYRIKKWVIKAVMENESISPNGYKRSGKLAIEADKTAQQKLAQEGTKAMSIEEFNAKALAANPWLKEEIDKLNKKKE